MAVGGLRGAGSQLLNPHLLITPYIRREAVSSSRIEGTQSSLSDLFFFEADVSEPPRAPDVQEVANYVHAMEYGLERLWRDLRLNAIAPVTNEMALNTIAQYDLGMPRSY